MRLALGVEYDGSEFHGWQLQENLRSVQSCLESAFSKIAEEPIKIFCAGRTDAKVHATHQVIHFDTQAVRPMRAWTLGSNNLLPPSISVQWAEEVDSEFHARFSALAREYCYIIFNHSIRSSLLTKKVTWYHPHLDVSLMQEASQYLIGEHDFTSFRSAQCESKTPMRNIHRINVMRQHAIVMIQIQANAFLHHMVRNIVGTLLLVGTGREEPAWLQEVLKSKDRRLAGMTASPEGLYLTNVVYPNCFNIPERKANFLFY